MAGLVRSEFYGKLVDIAKRMISLSFDITKNIKIQKLKNHALSLLALAHVRMGNIDAGLKMLGEMDDDITRLRALKKISIELAKEGRLLLAIRFINNFFMDAADARLIRTDLDLGLISNVSSETLQKVYSLDDLGIRDELLRLMVLQSIEEGRLRRAKKIVDRILNPYIKAMLLSRIGVKYAEDGKIGRSIHMFNGAMDIVKKLFDTVYIEGRDIYDSRVLFKNMLLAETVALSIIQAGLTGWGKEILDKVINIAKKMGDKKFRANIIYALIKNARNIGYLLLFSHRLFSQLCAADSHIYLHLYSQELCIQEACP